MNQNARDLLQKHFDLALEAPDGIKRLRELILTLAMQGKLVPQDPKDQPASELLKEIEAEKKRLVKEGKIKAPKPLPEVKPEDVPYAVSKCWEWVRLGEIGSWRSGSTPSRSNSAYYGGGIPWVKSGEVKQGRIQNTEETITEKALSECSVTLNPVGSVLIAMYGANIGEVGVLEIPATTNQAICACQIYHGIEIDFLIFLIHSMKQSFIDQGAGAAQPNISKEKIVDSYIPLPPLAEQKRIVAKIDQLMATCDTLEQLRNSRQQKRLDIHTSAIIRLLDAGNPAGSDAAWAFLQEHFGELYRVKANVAELRKVILQLAVMGKLVKQDPADQPASELLKEIEAEKKRLVKEGKIKAPKPLREIKPEDVPYAVPVGWEWVRLGELFRVTSGDNLTKEQMIEGPYPVYGGNGITGYHNAYNAPKPTVVIGRVGFYCGSVHLAPEKSWITDNAFFTIYDEDRLFQAYVIWLFRTINLQVDTSATAQPVISGSKIYPIPVPLPPQAEQKRIVAKIDQLMALCDCLEQGIEAATKKQSAVLAAVLAQV